MPFLLIGLILVISCHVVPTCLHQVLHGGEPFVDGGADGAIDEHAGEVGITHQGSPGQPRSLIRPANMTANQRCQAVRPGDVLKLTPPTGHDQGDVKTWQEMRK